MKRSKWITNISLMFGSSVLIIGYFWLGRWYISATVFMLSLLWFLIGKIHWHWMKNYLFAAMVLIAAVGTWLDFPVFGLAICAASFLIGWDLDHFYRRLDYPSLGEIGKSIEKRHLFNLFVAVTTGIVLSLLSEWIQVGFNFVVGIILSLFAVLGLVVGIRMTNKVAL